MTTTVKDYLKLLNKNYSDTVADLLMKYGPAKDDYYSETSYEAFIAGKSDELKNGDFSRYDEGLYCHHIDANRYHNLYSPDSIREDKYPFAPQERRRLVYCNLIEHAILHTQIALATNNEFGFSELTNHLLPNIQKWYIDQEQIMYHRDDKAYEVAYLSPEDANKLVLYMKAKVRE
ncbi:Tryptophan synthase subunit beta [Fructobacillus pseudoficulneus]|uniref:Tryptophan synthase subunit beta n=1 Tax=Fructobacillus pseudoficulneus TaxID=220714 RepID=A0A3F3H9G8_9LACO|nr:hypothetical protein [Fructobacillus pseudoficulneus]GAP02893.1 Tryptophan synthase subunit beta [Fructobacillus pseudoficulneus]SEH45382.1 hypothetical protein SAMN05660469_1259 [Fructobacillus pseudoficulneus]